MSFPFLTLSQIIVYYVSLYWPLMDGILYENRCYS